MSRPLGTPSISTSNTDVASFQELITTSTTITMLSAGSTHHQPVSRMITADTITATETKRSASTWRNAASMLRLRVDPERKSSAATALMTSAMPPITSTQPASTSTGLPQRPSRKRSTAFQPIHTATAHSATALTAAASTSARSKPNVRLTEAGLRAAQEASRANPMAALSVKA